MHLVQLITCAEQNQYQDIQTVEVCYKPENKNAAQIAPRGVSSDLQMDL